MLLKTKAILLHALKYGDNSLVVTLYTESHGRLSVLTQGSRSKKSMRKANILQPLYLLECDIDYKPGRELQRVREVKLAEPYQTIPFEITKSTEAIFLAEVLYKTLREEEANKELFAFLYNSFRYLDLLTEGEANFHLLFLMQLTRFLGFHPENNHSENHPYFDLVAGRFAESAPNHPHYLPPDLSQTVSQLIKINYQNCNNIPINGRIRQNLLNIILEYFSLHLGTHIQIKSLEVFSEIHHS